MARAADRDRLGGVLDLDPVEDVVDAVADLADLGRRGRIGGDQLVGEDAGADLPGADLARPRRGPCRGSPRSSRRRRRRRRSCPSTGWPSVLVAPMKESLPSSSLAEDLDLDPGGRADRRRHLVAVGGLAHRRGRDRADLSAPSSRASRTWVATTSPTSSIFSRQDRAVVVERLVDPRVGALLHHLLQLAIDRLRDEHAGGVGADIDGSAEHPGLPRMFPDARISSAGGSANAATRRDARRPRTRGRAR